MRSNLTARQLIAHAHRAGVSVWASAAIDDDDTITVPVVKSRFIAKLQQFDKDHICTRVVICGDDDIIFG